MAGESTDEDEAEAAERRTPRADEARHATRPPTDDEPTDSEKDE